MTRSAEERSPQWTRIPIPIPDFAADPRFPSGLVRVASILVLAAIVIGLTLFATKPAPVPQALAHDAIPVLTGNSLVLTEPAEAEANRSLKPQSSDAFELMADPSIDPKMVVRAPQGIDDAMVHRRR